MRSDLAVLPPTTYIVLPPLHMGMLHALLLVSPFSTTSDAPTALFSPRVMSTTKVNAAGGVVLSALTILACIYMMVNLIRQGLRKMRVRLLLAAVMSDIAIGLSTLPPQALSVAGRPILTGQRGCNAQAFLYTAALFTQPLMSLFLALATYILIVSETSPEFL